MVSRRARCMSVAIMVHYSDSSLLIVVFLVIFTLVLLLGSLVSLRHCLTNHMLMARCLCLPHLFLAELMRTFRWLNFDGNQCWKKVYPNAGLWDRVEARLTHEWVWWIFDALSPTFDSSALARNVWGIWSIEVISQCRFHVRTSRFHSQTPYTCLSFCSTAICRKISYFSNTLERSRGKLRRKGVVSCIWALPLLFL